MSRFFSSSLKGLVPYVPGEQPRDMQYIKLNTNESPYPPSDKATSAASAAACRLHLYPDPTCKALLDALAERYGVSPQQVLAGNGSDEILFFAFSAFCGEGCGAVFPAVTYGFYEVVAALCQIPHSTIPLHDGFRIDVADYAAIGQTVFLANPNAPTGIALPLSDIETLLQTNPDNVVVVDEAYVDFGGESAIGLLPKYDNLLVVQTFSKSRSMAGARLGMAFGSAELIGDLNRVRNSLNPYNINQMSLSAGVGTLADEAYTQDCIAHIKQTRQYAAERLKAMGFDMTESSANFLFAKHPWLSGQALYEKLKEKGILVRHFHTPGLEDYNRITVGTKAQMDALMAAIHVIEEEQP